MKTTTTLMVLLLGTASGLSAVLTPTATTLSSSLNPSTYGQPVIFTATVAPAPPDGEAVTFKQGVTLLGTGALSGGSATVTISTLTTGSADNVKAVYGGDSTFKTSSSNVVSQLVTQAPTTITLVSSQNPSAIGQAVTFTASVTPEFSGTVTGYVWFLNGSKTLGSASLSGGVGQYTTTLLPVGNDPITAVYKGGRSFTASTSAVLGQAVQAGTFIASTMTWDGVTRYYEVYLPVNLPANPPMLLMLHGTKFMVPPSNPSTLVWGWQPIADQYGFILVQPASTYDPKSGQWNWNSYFMDAAFPASESGTCTVTSTTSCPDDSGFLRQLIINLTAQYNVNPNAIYVTGMSSGAQMTERVGVEISDLVAAIAPVSGQMEGQQAAPPPVLVPGNAVAPISVQEWHGTLDTELPPCNYGTTVYSNVTFYLDTVDDTFNYWGAQNSCTTLQTTQPLCLNDAPNPNVTGNLATGCTNNVAVQFIWEENVGHVWNSKNNTAIWQFLAAHPK